LDIVVSFIVVSVKIFVDWQKLI